MVSYGQVIFWEPKSFRSAECNSLSRADPGSPLQPSRRCREAPRGTLSSPPCPAGRQLRLRQGGRQGTGWGNYTYLCPSYSQGLSIAAASRTLFHHSFHSLGLKTLIANCLLNFKRAGKGPAWNMKLLCILFFLCFLFTGRPFSDLLATSQSRRK